MGGEVPGDGVRGRLVWEVGWGVGACEAGLVLVVNIEPDGDFGDKMRRKIYSIVTWIVVRAFGAEKWVFS